MDRWSPRRSRSTTSFPRRRGSRRPSSPEFERARFKSSTDRFESYEEDEWPVRNKSGYRKRSRSPFSDHDRRSPLSDHDSFRGRTDRGRPFRGRSGMGRPSRGRSDRGRPFVERPYRGKSDRGGSDRGWSDRGRPNRAGSNRGWSDRGRPDRGGSDRGWSDRGRPFKEGSDRGRPFRGESDRGKPFRGRSDRGRPFRGRSDRGRTFRGTHFMERPFRGKPDRGGHYRERSHSRESYHSFQESSRNRQSKSRSRSNSRDRYYVMKSGNERYSDEEFIHSKMSRTRSNSRDRLYLNESIENERQSDDDSFERGNDRPRLSRSRSNSRGRLHPIDSEGNRESYFQTRKSRSRSNSRDRSHSTGHKVYYNRSFEIQNDYQLRKSRSRSSSGDRLYPTGPIKTKRYIDEEYEGQSKYKPREFRSNSRDRLSPSEAVGYNRNEPRIEISSIHKLKEPRISSYSYSSSQNLSLKDGRFKEEAGYSHSKPDMSYASRTEFKQDTPQERKCFIEDRVYDSKPKVYRLSSTFDHDLNEKPLQFKNYPSARALELETKSEHQHDFSSSVKNTSSPSYPQRYFDTNKEYYERKVKTEHTAVSTDNQNSFKRGYREDDEFQGSKKRSYQDSFHENFDQVGSSQHTAGPQDRFSNKSFPRKYEKFESDDNKDEPSFKNRTWYRGSAKNKNTEPQEDLRDLSQVIIFFDFTSSGIMRSLWAVLFSSFRRSDLWLNCIENCYEDDYKNMFYCILKWKSRDLARAEDVQPVKAKQKAGFMLVNELAQTNYTIKARPEYFCCSLETLKQKYEPQGVCRFILHKEARGVVTGFQLIEEIFEMDKHVELIFGGDEHKPSYLDGVKKFAENKNFKYRFVAEDFVSVSFNFSPEYIKHDLMENGVLSDKFELIPPLGPGKNLLDDYNLTGFLPNSTKFFHGTHITKIKKCKNFVGKMKNLEKRSAVDQITCILKEDGDKEMAKRLIETLPPRKKRKFGNKLLRSSLTN